MFVQFPTFSLILILSLLSCGRPNQSQKEAGETDPQTALESLAGRISSLPSVTSPVRKDNALPALWTSQDKFPSLQLGPLASNDRDKDSEVNSPLQKNKGLCEFFNMLNLSWKEMDRIDQYLCVLDKIRKEKMPSPLQWKETRHERLYQLQFSLCRHEKGKASSLLSLTYQISFPWVHINSLYQYGNGVPLDFLESSVEIKGKLDSEWRWKDKQIKVLKGAKGKNRHFILDTNIHQFSDKITLAGKYKGRRRMEFGQEFFQHLAYSVADFHSNPGHHRWGPGKGSAKTRLFWFFEDLPLDNDFSFVHSKAWDELMEKKGLLSFSYENIDSWDSPSYAELNNPEKGPHFQQAQDGPLPSTSWPEFPLGSLEKIGAGCHSNKENRLSPEQEKLLQSAFQSCQNQFLFPSNPILDCRSSS